MPENNKNLKSVSTGPKLDWLEGDIPVSKEFDDPYFSKNDGMAETRHVFINGNHLPQRFSNSAEFTIGELGFGTGLNFLTTALEWEAGNTSGGTLKFVSFEKYPMSASDMAKALSAWPEIAESAEKLAGLYAPSLAEGGSELNIKWSENVHLCVHIGEAAANLASADMMADAWFLDGFSPSKNPDMWSETLLMQVFAHTKPGGNFATYTAAGWVRRNLMAAGFEVVRVPGHAGKREMMVGNKPDRTAK